jgi:hypothetical protein
MRDARPLLIALLLATPVSYSHDSAAANGIGQPVPPHGTGGTLGSGGTLGTGGTGSGGIGPGAGTGGISTGGTIVR